MATGSPPAPVVKTYPPRGPLKQFRLATATPFWCFRCGEGKKSKLWALYEEDWASVLCNGCYGRLLSIFEIKAGTRPDDAKADDLAEIVLGLWTQVEAEAAFQAMASDRPMLATHLCVAAKRFIGSSERLATEIGPRSSLDWSGVVIGYCKAVEVEAVRRIVEPLREAVALVGLPEADLKDKDIGRIASYCVGRTATPPELGAIQHFLATAAHSKKRAASSPLLRAFRDHIAGRADSQWLVANDGACSMLEILTRDFRNPAAHIDELSATDFARCRSLIAGNEGILERLIEATSAPA